MTIALADICCASFASNFLGALADVRCVPGVRVALTGDRTWLRWDAEDQVVRRVLPIPGVRLYVQRDNLWFRHGRHLPAFEVPADLPYRPLYEVLTPAAVRPNPPLPWEGQPVTLTLLPDDNPRATSALRCALSAVAAWAQTVATAVLGEIQAAQHRDLVLLRGKSLPFLPGGERFWGQRVLAPLGLCLEPALAEPVILRALGLGDEEFLLLTRDKAEVLSDAVFQPLTRAGLRLATDEAKR
jgi:hypothetical protein